MLFLGIGQGGGTDGEQASHRARLRRLGMGPPCVLLFVGVSSTLAQAGEGSSAGVRHLGNQDKNMSGGYEEY